MPCPSRSEARTGEQKVLLGCTEEGRGSREENAAFETSVSSQYDEVGGGDPKFCDFCMCIEH